MFFTIITVVFVSIFSIGLFIYFEYTKRKERKKIIEKLKEIGEVKEVDLNAFDAVLTINNKKIFVKIMLLNAYKELSINSKRHYQVDASTKKLKLLKTGGFEKVKGNKIMLISPSLEKVVKYINENEVVFVKHDELCFDFHLFRVNEIDKIKDVFNKEKD